MDSTSMNKEWPLGPVTMEGVGQFNSLAITVLFEVEPKSDLIAKVSRFSKRFQ
jgi:hypothetical protein